jgi:putative ABC transport system ATP-binding protein
MTSAPLIAAQNVIKDYATEEVLTHAVNDIDLSVLEGDLLTITGPSGSGKSTLLSLLGLLDRPTRGEVLVAGRPTAGLSVAERARIRNATFAFVFQNFSLIPQLTAAQNVELPLVYRGVDAAERRKASADALERVGLRHRMNHYPSQISGGEQQRVAIARAVVTRPRVVLADEPTGNLDSHNAGKIIELLQELNDDGAAIVLVTHDPHLAELASRRVELMDGRVVSIEQPRAAAERSVTG